MLGNQRDEWDLDTEAACPTTRAATCHCPGVGNQCPAPDQPDPKDR